MIPQIISLALAFTSLATASPSRKYYPDQLTTVSSKSALNSLSVNAIDGFFTIGQCPVTHRGGVPSTSCPSSVPHCPAGNVTAIIYSHDQAALDAQVPGGQYIFVDKNGFLAYSAPHAGIIPKNASATGFYITGPKGEDPRGRFNFKGKTARGQAEGFMACPGADLRFPYSIVVKFRGFGRFDRYGECVPVELALSRYHSNQAAAWQYDVTNVS